MKKKMVEKIHFKLGVAMNLYEKKKNSTKTEQKLSEK